MRDIIMKVASEKIQIYGLRKFTMDEIASELKISKKTIYKYFKNKDDIIVEYFKEIIETDKNDTLESAKKDCPLVEKLNSIVYSYHKYKLPVNVLDEAYKFYNDEWKKIQQLRDFKLNLIEITIKEGMKEGFLRSDIQPHMITLMLEGISNTFLDYKFLSKNDMTMKDAMNDVMTILLYGILK
ncbi:TetR/AcrR family transcriptional regulator [Clostridium tagluense]|uniref:TetR family transcriptional regulator n=1 Tax=Clostridium tagluense TaxID=360422 RepID=A0A401UIB8_9CLOT|nr:TetR/AcrR family transcriptional regulator [Clostridium tagluense]MBU3129096.1 TetR/AcrR family transcriptional regulator [Clostridium tagluense]MCB2311316.1 TetR/AcrR family transcriptional regulator [Clostridium tagluense]MCB2316042.1 TetR/AcrR family transcriptional regulator [Clostridium tagluense]MCB2320892.1 TetR/AcrR family transcriptional regulator [Clostridium tagluense]MCB2325911.1 TetR/AcrR family transcriptional regulator [Clostridium tagluense]